MPLSIPNRDDWFDDVDGFPRPNWGTIDGWMRVFVAKSELDDAWRQWARHWLWRLRGRLGGDYDVVESENFHLLAELAPEARTKALSFFERARSHICKVLVGIAPAEAHGKHVILSFTEHDDYYAYIAHFYPHGTFAGSGGIFVHDCYCHIAYPQGLSPDADRRTIIHELTHNLLAHLPLPHWLGEALAMAFEADIGGGGNEPLSRELAARHREYWNRKTIQEFWQGKSYSDVDGQELAYSLSRILLNLIHTDLRPPAAEFRKFVLRADRGDAGATATREHLGVELESLVASFLGPGEWAAHPNTWRRGSNEESGEDSPEG